jgi:ribosomal-protein-alanine N-acetyltransferase
MSSAAHLDLPLVIEEMSHADALEIVGWRYPGEYSFYDRDADQRDAGELLDADLRKEMYFSVHGRRGALVGFLQLTKAGAETVDIGLGLRPELTGRGLGKRFVGEALAFTRTRFDARRFTLAVASFNERALRVYERCGFVEGARSIRITAGAEWEFVEMERPA